MSSKEKAEQWLRPYCLRGTVPSGQWVHPVNSDELLAYSEENLFYPVQLSLLTEKKMFELLAYLYKFTVFSFPTFLRFAQGRDLYRKENIYWEPKLETIIRMAMNMRWKRLFYDFGESVN